MIWLDKNPYKNAIAVKCDKCFKHIDVKGFYFNCSTCKEDFCKECIQVNRGPYMRMKNVEPQDMAAAAPAAEGSGEIIDPVIEKVLGVATNTKTGVTVN